MMTDHVLGDMLTPFFPLSGGQARLHERGLVISGDGGAVRVLFSFPKLGQPHMITGDAAARPLFGPDALTFELNGWEAERLSSLVREALAGRLALLPTAESGPPVPLAVQPAELVRPEEQLDVGGRTIPARYGGALSAAALAERQLYDVAVREDGGVWRRIAPHAVYRRERWDSFGIAHITDVHVARRIDRFRGLLAAAGRAESAQRLINWNDRFRGFVRYANILHRIGELDLILATGDLVDYIYEDDDDPDGGGNPAFLRELILGRARGPEFSAVEELRVPIFMVPGNHDYRKHAYKLLCDLHVGFSIFGKDVARIKNFSGYHMRQDDALALTNHLDGRPGSGVPNLGPAAAARMLEVDGALSAHTRWLADPGPYVVRLGDHRIVMLDTAHDVGMLTDLWDGLRSWLGTVSEDEDTFVGGSPNSEGISDGELQTVADALAEVPDEGLLILGLHAPLFNVRENEYPYFLRETQRPALPEQVDGFLAHQGGVPLPSPVAEELRRRHPTWFPGEHDRRPPTFVKRVDSEDLLDFGVARGRAGELMRLLAGVGARRPADLVLSGHIHRRNEFRVWQARTGELTYAMDFYTQNPAQYYPTPFTKGWTARPGQAGQPAGMVPERETTYVEIVPGAAPDASPWPMPRDAMFPYQLQVPPYANPLSAAPDTRVWWSQHRPLVLQSGALGPLDSSQVSFSGFRLVSVKDNVIDAIHVVTSERLEATQYQLPWEEAIRPDAPRRHRYRERSRPLGSPPPAGAPAALLYGAQGTQSAVYRDSAGQLHEVWQRGDATGAGNLSSLAGGAPRAAGDPRLVTAQDGSGSQVALYRGADGHVHSLYWSGDAVGHDALSATAGAPKAAGSPLGYVGAGGYTHVIYRAHNGHLQELWWHGEEPPGYSDLTGGSRTPPAAGDPSPYVSTRSGDNIVIYRGTDGHIHSLYWLDGPTGHDNLSRYAGAPRAAGDPQAYYTAYNDVHQVVYRSADGQLHELWWGGSNPVSHWNLTLAAGGAPLAASDPAVYYSAGTNTKHVIYRGADGHLHEIWWVPGGGIPAHEDLTVAALAPLAAYRPAAFTIDGPNSQHVVYRGADGQLHEIRWV